MRVVIADTGPLHYLILIGHVEILPVLFETVSVPSSVRDELSHPEAPAFVRRWISNPPAWLDVHAHLGPGHADASWLALDPGEKDALALAASLHADLLLMDDRAGFRVAIRQGFAVTGTLGILRMAAQRRLLDLSDAFTALKATNSRSPEALMKTILQEHQGQTGK